MKIPYTLSRLLPAALGLVWMMHSCLAPDMSDCPEWSVRLEVRLAEESRMTDRDEDIENVYIYIFDDRQRFVTVWTGDAYIPGELYETYLDLDPGTYYFVAWTNQGGMYNAVSASGGRPGQNASMNDLIVEIDNPSGDPITEDIPDLYYGMLDGATVLAAQSNDFTIYIKPNIYRINFIVEGLAVNEEDLVFSVTDNNARYSFDNSIVQEHSEITYARTGQAGARGEVEASMRVLKLTSRSTPEFDLTDTASSIRYYTDDLVDMIKKAYNTGGYTVDFDQTHEFDIKLTFRSLTDVEITVNGWSYSPNDTELRP